MFGPHVCFQHGNNMTDKVGDTVGNKMTNKVGDTVGNKVGSKHVRQRGGQSGKQTRRQTGRQSGEQAGRQSGGENRRQSGRHNKDTVGDNLGLRHLQGTFAYICCSGYVWGKIFRRNNAWRNHTGQSHPSSTCSAAPAILACSS